MSSSAWPIALVSARTSLSTAGAAARLLLLDIEQVGQIGAHVDRQRDGAGLAPGIANPQVRPHAGADAVLPEHEHRVGGWRAPDEQGVERPLAADGERLDPFAIDDHNEP